MAAPGPVEIIETGSDAGLSYDEIDARLREQIPGITTSEMADAYGEAIDRLKREREEILRLLEEVHRIAAEEGIAWHPKTPTDRVLQIAADRGNKRAAALLEALRRH